MSIITPDRIAEIIEDALAWAIVGLSVSKEPLRDAARHELAEHLFGALYRCPPDNSAQLALPLS